MAWGGWPTMGAGRAGDWGQPGQRWPCLCLGHWGSRGGGETWPASGEAVNIETLGFPDRLQVEAERKRGTRVLNWVPESLGFIKVKISICEENLMRRVQGLQGGVVSGDNNHTLRFACKSHSCYWPAATVWKRVLTSPSPIIRDAFIHHPHVSGTVLDAGNRGIKQSPSCHGA